MSCEGHCLCGAVRFAAATDPIIVRSCWCRDCQYLASGGATHNAFFKSDDVAITGEVRWFDSVADSGTMPSRGFCPTCGTPMFTQSHARRHLIGIRVGTLADRDRAAPGAVIWTVSAPAWARLDPDMPRTERQPPPVA